MAVIRSTYMDLLYWLTWGALDSSAYGVVENDDLLDTRIFGAEQAFNLRVVAFPYSLFVGEQLLLGRELVDSKTGVVGSEVMFSASQVVDVSVVVVLLEVIAGSIDLGPGPACVGGGIDVFEACGGHVVSLSG